MKWGICIALLFLCSMVQAQNINFEEDFSEQNLSAWNGDTTDFTFTKENGNILLQLNADSAGTSILSHPSTEATGSWEFFIRMDFAPSNNNKLQIFLMSDRADLTGAVNGYMLQAGENGSEDVLRLFKMTDGEKESEVLAGTTNIGAGGEYRIKVSRDAGGYWKLETAPGYSGILTEEATGFNKDITSTSWFGLVAHYTRSNIQDMAFDFKIDIPPFKIASHQIINPQSIQLIFNRPFDTGSIHRSDFMVTPGNLNPDSVTPLSGDTLNLEFDSRLPSGFNQLHISGIEDEAGEQTLADTTLSFLIYDEYSSGDVIINEIMKDPPDGTAEYIELKNRSGKYLNLQHWILGDNQSLRSITDHNLLLSPHGHRVFTSDTGALNSYFSSNDFIEVSLPSFNNGSDQVRLYLPDSTLVDSLQYEAKWGGIKTSLERRSETAPSIYAENWEDSTSLLGGTPGFENQAKPDLNPPEIKGLKIINEHTLQLIASKRVTKTTAQNPANYRLLNADGTLAESAIQAINQTAKDSITIELNSPIKEGIYQLFVSGLADIFDNSMASDSISFEFIELSEAGSGDLVINEFMYDPPEDYSEFIELYNPTDSNFNLKDWTVNDNTGSLRTLSTEDLIIRSQSYLVLLPDSTMIYTNPDYKYHLSSLPSLNNREDGIALRNASGRLIDSLAYTSVWGGDGVSLERRSPEVMAIYSENWGNSPAPLKATPGVSNSIAPDTQAPFIIRSEATEPNQIVLTFDETLDPEQFPQVSSVQLQPSIPVEQIVYSGRQLLFRLQEELINGTNYSLSIRNVTDLFGNRASELSTTFRHLTFSDAGYMDVVFNEILYRRANETAPEFVELFNPTQKHLDLSGWTFSDAGNQELTLPNGLQIASGEYLVFTDRHSFNATDGQTLYLNNFPSLNDRGDALVLKDSTGTIIDSLYYRDSWGGNEPGTSLERKDPLAASSDLSNWNSAKYQPHSAGRQNTIYAPDSTPPEIIFARYRNKEILVVFSEFIRLHPGTEIYADDLQVHSLVFDSTMGQQLSLTGITSAPEHLSIRNLMDFRGNITGDATLPVAHKPAPGELIINEILYDPLADNEDNLPDQSEYVEVYNASDHAISLEGLRLHDAPDENEEVRVIHPFSTLHRWLPSGGYLLIYADNETSELSESGLAEYFGLNGNHPFSALRVNRTSLSLGTSGDAIYLADSTGLVLDSVYYDESWQNPNVYDTRGRSLERIDPDGPSGNASNWSSSTDTRGGTPGEENSIFQKPGTSPDDTGISFSPNPFSPDDDGFEDQLFINYKLDEPDYLLRIRIFDRYGRQVRKLADGKIAGYEGAVLWDGLTDERRKNRVGIYIVLFEALDSAAGKNLQFKKTVVLARKF